jgi:hypothetical protein
MILSTAKKVQNLIIYNDDSLTLWPDLEIRANPSVLGWIVIFTEKDLNSLLMLNASHAPLPAEFQDVVLHFN